MRPRREAFPARTSAKQERLSGFETGKNRANGDVVDNEIIVKNKNFFFFKKKKSSFFVKRQKKKAHGGG